MRNPPISAQTSSSFLSMLCPSALSASDLKAMNSTPPLLPDHAKQFSSLSRWIFEVGEDCSASGLIRSAKAAVALDTYVASHNLNMTACHHQSKDNPANEDTIGSMILEASMPTGSGVPIADEYE
jgi:hypothetical protein